MSARTDPLTHHSSSDRHDRPKASQTKPRTSFSSREASAARSAVSALLQVQPVSLSILIVVAGISLWLGYGFVMGKISPEVMVTVQQFEVPAEVANRLSLSGKSASDIAQDVINDVLASANRFNGPEYYKYDGVATHLRAASKSVKTPVETSYGIELKGISLDNLMHLYNSSRYQQWSISGDILSSSHGLVGRVRSSLRDRAGFWQTPPSSENDPAVLIQEATYLMLAGIDPELFGRACLQRGDYEQAARVFRQWEMDDPQNWKPTYYLSLTYSYQQGKEKEADLFANWSEEVKTKGYPPAASKTVQTTSKLQSDEQIATVLRRTVELAGRTKLDPGALQQASREDNLKSLQTMKEAEAELRARVESDPQVPDYSFEEARTIAKIALVQSYIEPGLPDAGISIDRALDEFASAAKSLPDNGGFHQQLAVFSAFKVEIMQRHKDPLPAIEKVLEEEIQQYRIALRMRPSETPPFWGAIYAQLALGRPEQARDLARTMVLLQPESQDARIAFVLAAERDASREETARDEDTYLKQLLSSNLEENKLEVLWSAFRDAKNDEKLRLVVAEGRQRFPHNPRFQSSIDPAQPKPRSGHQRAI